MFKGSNQQATGPPQQQHYVIAPFQPNGQRGNRFHNRFHQEIQPAHRKRLEELKHELSLKLREDNDAVAMAETKARFTKMSHVHDDLSRVAMRCVANRSDSSVIAAVLASSSEPLETRAGAVKAMSAFAESQRLNEVEAQNLYRPSSVAAAGNLTSRASSPNHHHSNDHHHQLPLNSSRAPSRLVESPLHSARAVSRVCQIDPEPTIEQGNFVMSKPLQFRSEEHYEWEAHRRLHPPETTRPVPKAVHLPFLMTSNLKRNQRLARERQLREEMDHQLAVAAVGGGGGAGSAGGECAQQISHLSSNTARGPPRRTSNGLVLATPTTGVWCPQGPQEPFALPSLQASVPKALINRGKVLSPRR